MKIFILSIIASLLLQVNAHGYDDLAYSSRSIQRRDENETEITTPKIYGRDLLGWGVDLRIARPEESLKTPLFLFEYSEMVDDNTYIYPLSPEIQFHVPDQVYVRTIAEQFANSRIFTRVDLYIKQLNLELGLSIEASKENSNSSTESTDGEPNLSTFSGDVEVTYNARNLNNQTKVLTTNSLEYALWQLVISPDQVVRSKVQTRIDFTAQANNDSVYYEFFDRQGTHYIESVIVGGKLEMSNLVNTSFDEDTDKIAAAASLTFKKAFGLDSFSANASIDYTTTITTFEQETQMTMKAYGGDPDVSSFFGGAVDASATFVAWQQSVISNPAVIRYRLRDVTWLFPYSIRPDAREALRKYLKGQLQP